MKGFLGSTLEAIWQAIITTLVIALLGSVGIWAALEYTETGQDIQQTISVVSEISVEVVQGGDLNRLNELLDEALEFYRSENTR